MKKLPLLALGMTAAQTIALCAYAQDIAGTYRGTLSTANTADGAQDALTLQLTSQSNGAAGTMTLNDGSGLPMAISFTDASFDSSTGDLAVSIPLNTESGPETIKLAATLNSDGTLNGELSTLLNDTPATFALKQNGTLPTISSKNSYESKLGTFKGTVINGNGLKASATLIIADEGNPGADLNFFEGISSQKSIVAVFAVGGSGAQATMFGNLDLRNLTVMADAIVNTSQLQENIAIRCSLASTSWNCDYYSGNVKMFSGTFTK
jgi:hypothetical protein